MLKVRVKEDVSLESLAKGLNLYKELIIDSNRSKLLESGFIEGNSQINLPTIVYPAVKKSKIVELVNVEAIRMHDLIQHDTILNTNKPYDSLKLYRDIEKIIQLYPFVEHEVIGHSVLGKPIIELTIGKGMKRIHMNGSFHANEWITTNVMLQWLIEYLDTLVKGKHDEGQDCYRLYKTTTLSFVPMVNPDGVDLVLNGLPNDKDYQLSLLDINNHSRDFSQWKANIRGIDLNNQYPANWEIEKERKIPKSPAPRDYPGDAPLTEPESIALAELVKKRNFDRILAFHTQGEEIYWGYQKKEPIEAEHIVNEFERLSGYKAVRDIDSHAGFRDWYVNEWRKPGYTVELGLGVNPLPFSQLSEIYRKSRGIFFAALYM